MRRAVVIGSDGPPHMRLKYAVTDAHRFSATLASATCDFDVTSSIEEEASDAREKLLKVAESCHADDTFLVYFAGHGVVDYGDLFLLFANSKQTSLMQTSLQAHEILTCLRRCKARNRVLILDCCNAGQITSRSGIRSGTNARVSMKELGFESDSFDIVLASDALESAREFDKLSGGFFSVALNDGLTKRKAQADQDQDGAISVADIHSWLESRARTYNKSEREKLDHVPIPRRVGVGHGITYLSKPPLTWPYLEIPLPDGIPGIVLPTRTTQFGPGWACVLGKYPVTNAAYARVMKGQSVPIARRFDRKWASKSFEVFDDPDFGDPKKPIVGVTLSDIKEYCLQLRRQSSPICFIAPPTLAMWKRAALGPFNDRSNAFPGVRKIQSDIHDQSQQTAPCVDAAHRANKYGFIDLIGNVWEWCIEERQASWFYSKDAEIPAIDGQKRSISILAASPSTRKPRLRAWLQGGGFYDNADEIHLTIDADDIAGGPNSKHADVGFRLSGFLPIRELPPGWRELFYEMPNLEPDRSEPMIM